MKKAMRRSVLPRARWNLIEAVLRALAVLLLFLSLIV